MELETFLHDLHYDVDKTKPPGWEIDWNDKPLPYKLYRGVPTVTLAAEIPLVLPANRPLAGAAAREYPGAGSGANTLRKPGPPDLRTIGHFLWYAYGLAQVSDSILATMGPGQDVFRMQRRFAPSGGGLYPNELYVYLNIGELPEGVYHYDTAHHRLALLREGRFDGYIARALGNSCDVGRCFGVAFVSSMFWKNFFKYNHFSYRLQALDAGAMMGQLLESAKRFGWEAGVHYRFLDRAVNRLLGLSGQEESVYAVIPLSAESADVWFAGMARQPPGAITAERLCSELPAIQHDQYVRSKRIKPYPLLNRMNEASMLESLESLGPVGLPWMEAGGSSGRRTAAGERYRLPVTERLEYDFASACRQRYSPDADFVLGSLEPERLAALLREATESFVYRNDLDGFMEPSAPRAPRVGLYGILHQVEGIPDGSYRYDSAECALLRLRPGDLRLWVQEGMPAHNVNVLQVPLVLHVAGDRRHYLPALGYRGYRIQQMEAGMLTQRVLLSAAALGLNGHPLLGYDARLCDELYRLPEQRLASLIQIPVGWTRPSPRLAGALHG
ncbi:SagB family peptide dehydrogenase [Paenibacillus sp. NPDC056579]|uniref:SagB family peptide dehydrogenase n=1 Tax=Paenibacillus sp. NPDC056579 TaxID=3345871 RepID=UPI0036C07C7E